MKKTLVGFVDPWYATFGKDKWGYDYWPNDKRGGILNLPTGIYINNVKCGCGDDYLKITITVEIEEARQKNVEGVKTHHATAAIRKPETTPASA